MVYESTDRHKKQLTRRVDLPYYPKYWNRQVWATVQTPIRRCGLHWFSSYSRGKTNKQLVKQIWSKFRTSILLGMGKIKVSIRYSTYVCCVKRLSVRLSVLRLLVCVSLLFLLMSGMGYNLWLWHSLDSSFYYTCLIENARADPKSQNIA